MTFHRKYFHSRIGKQRNVLMPLFPNVHSLNLKIFSTSTYFWFCPPPAIDNVHSLSLFWGGIQATWSRGICIKQFLILHLRYRSVHNAIFRKSQLQFSLWKPWLSVHQKETIHAYDPLYRQTVLFNNCLPQLALGRPRITRRLCVCVCVCVCVSVCVDRNRTLDLLVRF